MSLGADPIVAAKSRFRQEQEAKAARAIWLAQWPMVLVPSTEDRALGYDFISADDAQMPEVKRVTTARRVYDLARAGGWWVAASQAIAIVLSNRKDGTKGQPERHEHIGVHAFWPGRFVEPGTVGVVAWWDNGAFNWAARADYRIQDGRLVYDRTSIDSNECKRVIKAMGGS